MADYEAEFDLPDGVSDCGGTARVSIGEGMYHSDPDEACFPCLTIEMIDLGDGGDVQLWASCREDVAELRKHLTAALDALEKEVDEYVAADPKRTTAPPA